MQSLLICLTFVTLLCFVSQTRGKDCVIDKPCELDAYFTAKRGYQCIQRGPDAQCTCPGGEYEYDVPCRLCNRTDYRRNVCDLSKAVFCVETEAYGTSFACVCPTPAGSSFVTTSYSCDPTVTLTSTAPTTTSAGAGASLCLNGGVLVGSRCDCPSGFSGQYCGSRTEGRLCEDIYCKNAGTCGIRNPSGPYESYCSCKPGTSGDYCELNATVGGCSASSCSNGGVCKETRVGSTLYAYCYCAAGFNGIKCQNSYFTCPGVGNWADNDMYYQGKYFECTVVSGILRAVQRSCPKGLRYNMSAKLCTR